VAAAAIIASVAIAVAGWLVSQAQARRATRRNMRIDYLLDAYRRLERASNRPLTQDVARELEAAVGDVMLLGSPEQAALATAFTARFAAERQADLQPLLLALRDSLRNELLLGELPPSAFVSLRISSGGETVSGSAHAWREAMENAWRSIMLDLDDIERANLNRHMRELAASDDNTTPSAAVAASALSVERLLRDLLAGSTADEVGRLPMPQLANEALELGLIDPNLADSISGLNAMHMLAAMDQDRLTEQRAAEFASLATAIGYLLGRAIRARNPAAPE
jgi:hypothetical protein